jgi:hypothetical protein
LEVWILSAQFEEDVHLKQISSINTFNAIHLLDFEGLFNENEISKNNQSAKGIYITCSNINLNFKIKAHENINIVSFIYSKRWLDINLHDTLHYKFLFDTTYLLKKYSFNETFDYLIAKLKIITQKHKDNSFILKINIFVLLNNVLEFISNESPSEKKSKESILDLVEKIEAILLTDFEIPISKINAEIIKNGFNIKEFMGVFKKRNNSGLFEFRQTKKIKLALKLLEEGYQVNEVARKIGFKTDSKFIVSFKQEYGDTPNKYIKSLKTTITD